MTERKRIAAVTTIYRPRSHADVIITKFLKGFPTDEGLLAPRVDIVSMYIDQFLEDIPPGQRDIGRRIAAEHDVPIFGSIRQALTMGGRELAVDGVLHIGEHGDYPGNEKGQKLYPRRCFMEQIFGVLAASKRSVPVFNDKHLSYNWHDAKWMYDRAVELGVPFMAGSSVPVVWRSPWLEFELDTAMEEAVVVCGYPNMDINGFHMLEAMQAMVERRSGGETGVTAVTWLEGDAVWQAAGEGLWSRDLGEAACAAMADRAEGGMEDPSFEPSIVLIEYRDGFRAAALTLKGYTRTKGFAARSSNSVESCEFSMHGDPHPHFSYLSLNIEEMFVTGVPSYPVERTLLVSGMVEAALDSRYQGCARVETPHLDVVYRSHESLPWHPTAPRPMGASLVPFKDPVAEGAGK